MIDQIKASEDSGSFEVVISTADIDRQGEVVDQGGWDLNFYKLNPVVLWGHDYHSLPIGVTDSIEIRDGKLIAKGRFAPAEANPFAQQVRKLYDLKIVRATSVGFIVKNSEGQKITQAELLEFSFVPVPANPYALSLSLVKEYGLDLGMLAVKGLELKAEPEEEKIARVLSKEHRNLVSTAVTQMKELIAAFEELLKAANPEGNEGEEHSQETEDDPKQRSIPTGLDLKKELDSYFLLKSVLRAVNTATAEALAKDRTLSKSRSK